MLRAEKFAGAKRLYLPGGLEYFSKEIFDLAKALEILNLSSNYLASLPNDLTRLNKLKVMFCSDN
jgi:Leucine-rich repeat (LRR) protein